MNPIHYNAVTTATTLVLAVEKGRPLVRLAGQLEVSDEFYVEHLHPDYPIADLGHASYFAALMGGEPYEYWLGASHG